MKNRAIKLFILLSIATLSLTACGQKSEPVNNPVETVTEETTEENTTGENATEESTTDENAIEESTTEDPAATETSDTTSNNPYANYGKNDPSLEGYEVTITEELNTEMYVVKDYDYRKLDNEKAGKISPAEIGAYVTVTGKTSNGWYEIQCGLVKGYLPPEILSTENPLPPADLDEVNPETGKTTQETLDDFHDLMNDPELEAYLAEEGLTPREEEVTDISPAPDYDAYREGRWD